MASGNTLTVLIATAATQPAWAFVAFTSGSTEPSPGDVIWGDTSDENGILEVQAICHALHHLRCFSCSLDGLVVVDLYLSHQASVL